MSAALGYLIRRNVKVYFKDKSSFFMSLISPLILFVLFITFLRSVYESSFQAMIPEGVVIEKGVIDAFTGGWLMSSILGVSCVTIAFCANILMAQDRVTGGVCDLMAAPIKKSTLALSYYIANMIATGIVCFAAAAVGFLYLSVVGWYFTVTDVLLILLDVLLCVLFGTALAALVENFISTQGGISAVASLVSALYGFLCGAYMPISQFSEPIRNFVAFIPGTYGTGLLRNHYMDAPLRQLEGTVPQTVLDGIRNGFDGNLYFFGNQVALWQMYLILIGSTALLLGVYVFIHYVKNKKK